MVRNAHYVILIVLLVQVHQIIASHASPIIL